MANHLTDQQLIIAELEKKLCRLKILIRRERFASLKYENNGWAGEDKIYRHKARVQIDSILKEVDSKQLNIDL